MKEKSDPGRSVFINCPYDRDYAPLFDAILFATVCSGFVPRSAIETNEVGKLRMDRIRQALRGSRYSIHDLSRSRGEGEEGFARFNMPLELGMAMALRQHEWLLLIPANHPYHRFASDLAGYDPETYSENDGPGAVVPSVIGWLYDRRLRNRLVDPHAPRIPTPREVLDALPLFQERRIQLGIDWVGKVPWDIVLFAARECSPNL